MRASLPKVVAMASLLLLPAGCEPPAPADVGLSEADEAAIRQVTASSLAIANAPTPDYDAYARSYYAPEAIVLPANGPAVEGEAAIAAFMKSFPPLSRIDFEIIEIEGTANMAWVRGTYSLTMTPPGGPPLADNGKYLEIWKKQPDGTWKVVRDIFNSDLPVPTDSTAHVPTE